MIVRVRPYPPHHEGFVTPDLNGNAGRLGEIIAEENNGRGHPRYRVLIKQRGRITSRLYYFPEQLEPYIRPNLCEFNTELVIKNGEVL